MKTLKKSRVVALGAVSETIENASDMINEAIQKYVAGNLEYRRDIGAKKVWINYKILKCTVINASFSCFSMVVEKIYLLACFWVLKFRYKSIHF